MKKTLRPLVEIQRRALWQALVTYALGATVGTLLIRYLTGVLDLPPRLPLLGAVLFVVLLPVVLLTALLRERTASGGGPRSGSAGGAGWTSPDPEPEKLRNPERRVPATRRVLLGLVAVFALWGVLAAGWVVYGEIKAARSSAVAVHSNLVVLPFENLGLAEDEYFADGVTEEITARLSEIPELGVISRTSAAHYKASDKSLREIAEELDVDYVLEGTVRWDHRAEGRSRVRVTPQLVRVADDTNVWARQYDAVLSEIFRVQSAIAEAVALALDVTVLEPQRRALSRQPTENLEAYDSYLRGNEYYDRRFVEQDAQRAVQMYERAVERDPEFALAYAALSRALVWLNSQFGHSERLPRARTAVEEALRLAPDLAEAHMALGDYYYYGRLALDDALAEYLWVQRRQPANSDASALIAWIQRRQGSWDLSIVNAERALELDPRNTVWVVGQAQNYFYTRNYELAESYFQRAIDLASDVPYYYRWAAWMYLAWDGRTERAWRLLQRSFYRIEPARLLVGSEASWVILNVFGQEYAPTLERLGLDDTGVDSAYYYLAKAQVKAQVGEREQARAYYDSARVVLEVRCAGSPRHVAPHTALGVAYAGLGRKEDAIREGVLGTEMLPVSLDAVTGPDRVRDLARIYVMVGEHEAAIERLEYLLSIPSTISAALLQVDPFWDPLRSYARFQALIEDGRRGEYWKELDDPSGRRTTAGAPGARYRKLAALAVGAETRSMVLRGNTTFND